MAMEPQESPERGGGRSGGRRSQDRGGRGHRTGHRHRAQDREQSTGHKAQGWAGAVMGLWDLPCRRSSQGSARGIMKLWVQLPPTATACSSQGVLAAVPRRKTPQGRAIHPQLCAGQGRKPI